MISIIIPIYNGSKTIGNCLESICRQDYQDFEIIIVNDGSTDNTAQDLTVAQKKWPEKIKIIHQTNQGAPAARNRGFQECKNKNIKNKFLLFCDADVLMEKEMLKKMIKAMKAHPNVSYIYSSFKFGWKKFKLWPFDSDRLREMPFIHTTSLIRYEHFPGWDESIKRLQDWDLWLTMLEHGYVGFWLPEILFKIIDTKGTMSQWLPSFCYKIPFRRGRTRFTAVSCYNEAVALIKQKHNLI